MTARATDDHLGTPDVEVLEGHAAPDQSTILIVDDDSTARLALAAIVAPGEYRIAFASDAADARERLSRIRPDVIICDLVMAEMCGDEFFRWLQAHDVWRFVPVIGVTRIDNHVVRTDLLLAGADAVLVKPCLGPELRAHVQAALRTRRKYLALRDCSGELHGRSAVSAA